MERVLMQFWTVNRFGRRTAKARWRQYERHIDAVRDAWQMRPARISPRGVLTVQTGQNEWTRYRIKLSHGWLSANSWATYKQLLIGQQEWPQAT